MTGVILLAVLGLATLIVGAEWLVRGASRIATSLGISPLVVGLTIVAAGTSSPELAVSLKATLGGQAEVAVGNAVGSNIFNVLCILGLAALITPLVVRQRLVWIDVPVMIAVSAGLWVLCRDGALGRLDGALLCSGLVVYTVAAIVTSRREPPDVRQEYDEAVPPPRAGRALWVSALLVVLGLGLCIAGSRWLVDGSVSVARALGVSELIIGLTVVAAGTSLPEVATSVLAAIRGQRDIAVGNVVGSNIFNVLGILGAAGLVTPRAIPIPPAALAVDIPVMTAVAVACLPIVFTGHEIRRWEGTLFLGFYIAYVTFLVLASARHDAAEPFGALVLFFAAPLAALGVIGSVVAALLRRQATPEEKRGASG